MLNQKISYFDKRRIVLEDIIQSEKNEILSWNTPRNFSKFFDIVKN